MKANDKALQQPPTYLSEEGRGPWIQTSTGGRYFFADPAPEDIHISDVANGLAKEQRYAGQTKIDLHYSVAEHSILMTRYAFDKLKWGPAQSLCVLLHDAFEAYGKDIAAPEKVLIGPEYKVMDRAGTRAILLRYGLVNTFAKCKTKIKELDVRILVDERPQVFSQRVEGWGYPNREITPLGVDLKFWSAPVAKRAFLHVFTALAEKAGVIIEEEIIYD